MAATAAMTLITVITVQIALPIALVLTLLYFVSPLADRSAAWNAVVRRETRLTPPSARSAGAGFRYPELCVTWLPEGQPGHAVTASYYGKGPSPVFDLDMPCTIRREHFWWKGRKRDRAGSGGGCSEEQAAAFQAAVDALRRQMSDPTQGALPVALEHGRGYYVDRATPPDPRAETAVNAAAAGHSYGEIVLVRALEPDGKGWRIQAFDRSTLPPAVQEVLKYLRIPYPPYPPYPAARG